MAEILQFDEFLFKLINGQWTNGLLDSLMPIWRNKIFWIPFYLFILAMVGINFPKKILPFLCMALVCIGIADTISSRLIKKTVKRERPCRNAALAEEARVLIKCGGGYSFTSSHATNHFAIGVFFMLTLSLIFPYSKYIFILWAFSISYGQVYVGVHYPLDVIFGALIGSVIGYIAAYFFNQHWPILDKKVIQIA